MIKVVIAIVVILIFIFNILIILILFVFVFIIIPILVLVLVFILVIHIIILIFTIKSITKYNKILLWYRHHLLERIMKMLEQRPPQYRPVCIRWPARILRNVFKNRLNLGQRLSQRLPGWLDGTIMFGEPDEFLHSLHFHVAAISECKNSPTSVKKPWSVCLYACVKEGRVLSHSPRD